MSYTALSVSGSLFLLSAIAQTIYWRRRCIERLRLDMLEIGEVLRQSANDAGVADDPYVQYIVNSTVAMADYSPRMSLWTLLLYLSCSSRGCTIPETTNSAAKELAEIANEAISLRVLFYCTRQTVGGLCLSGIFRLWPGHIIERIRQARFPIASIVNSRDSGFIPRAC